MGKVSALDAFDILVKDNKESLLKAFGQHGINKITIYFVKSVDGMVDVNNESVQKAYVNAIANGAL